MSILQETKRVYYLDLLKFIAIVCVCSYHFAFLGNLDYIDGVSKRIFATRLLFNINSICIPLFFMVNGSLLLNRELKIKKYILKCLLILFQYYFWRFITILALSRVNDIDLSIIGRSNIFNAVFLWSDIDGIDLAHLWFIPSLLCVYFVFPFIKFAFDRLDNDKYGKTLFFYLLSILFVICFIFNDLSTIGKLIPRLSNIKFSNIQNLNPFQGLVGALLFYFVLGGLLYKNRERLKKIKNYKLIIIFIFGMLLQLGKWYIESKSSNATWDGVFGGYSSTPTLMMTVSIYILVSKISNKVFEKSALILNTVKTVGENTLVVYYLHWIFGYTVLMEFYPYFRTHTGVLINLAKAVCVVILFSYIGALLKKIPIVGKLLS